MIRMLESSSPSNIGFTPTGCFEEDIPETPGMLGNANSACRAWIFGEMRGAQAFKNAAMAHLINRVSAEWRLEVPMVREIYTNTLPDAPLRRLAVDMVVQSTTNIALWAKTAHVGREGRHIPRDYLFDILEKLDDPKQGQSSSGKAHWQMSKCDYHDHSDPNKRSKRPRVDTSS